MPAFSGVTKSGSLEEGAGKRCSECGVADGEEIGTRQNPKPVPVPKRVQFGTGTAESPEPVPVLGPKSAH